MSAVQRESEKNWRDKGTTFLISLLKENHFCEDVCEKQQQLAIRRIIFLINEQLLKVPLKKLIIFSIRKAESNINLYENFTINILILLVHQKILFSIQLAAS